MNNGIVCFDKGPSRRIARLFAGFPDYSPNKDYFWFDWGPIFYRGRLDGSARVLCVASDPGPTERIASRALVGDSGQRVQGFLKKLGLIRSYLCLNAFVYALHPRHLSHGKRIVKDPLHVKWRNRLFNALTSSKLQAIVAFGCLAHIVIELWNGKKTVPVFDIYHPSFRDQTKLLPTWRDAIKELRKIVTPDVKSFSKIPNYGDIFSEDDYAPIPREDLPFGVPSWLGDDSWGRASHPRHLNCVRRPKPDDEHTLIWIAPNG
jgi:uracil-DNA glycosylase